MSFTCPRCGVTSHHPMDAGEGYCAACHDWTAPRHSKPLYYNKEGVPLTALQFAALLSDLNYRRVALTILADGIEVSTVFLGMDHNFGATGPPLLFETMVFGGELDQECERWPNEVAALAGHDQWVARVRERVKA